MEGLYLTSAFPPSRNARSFATADETPDTSPGVSISGCRVSRKNDAGEHGIAPAKAYHLGGRGRDTAWYDYQHLGKLIMSFCRRSVVFWRE